MYEEIYGFFTISYNHGCNVWDIGYIKMEANGPIGISITTTSEEMYRSYYTWVDIT